MSTAEASNMTRSEMITEINRITAEAATTASREVAFSCRAVANRIARTKSMTRGQVALRLDAVREMVATNDCPMSERDAGWLRVNDRV